MIGHDVHIDKSPNALQAYRKVGNRDVLEEVKSYEAAPIDVCL